MSGQPPFSHSNRRIVWPPPNPRCSVAGTSLVMEESDLLRSLACRRAQSRFMMDSPRSV